MLMQKNYCIIIALLFLIPLSLYGAFEWHIGNYQVISVKEITDPPVIETDESPTTYCIQSYSATTEISPDDTLAALNYEIGDIPTYYKWYKNGQVVSTFPYEPYVLPCLQYQPNLGFFFATKTRQWIMPYSYFVPHKLEGTPVNKGVLFFSEDGKTLKKRIELSNNNILLTGIMFNSAVKSDSLIGYRYTNANYIFIDDKIMTINGEIVHELTSPFLYAFFTDDGKLFHTYRYDTDNSYYHTETGALVYNGVESSESFTVSDNGKWGVSFDSSWGRLYLSSIDPVTKKPTIVYKPHLKDIKGLPYTEQRIDLEDGTWRSYYDVDVRFQEGSDKLIIITDKKWECVVEILNEKK